MRIQGDKKVGGRLQRRRRSDSVVAAGGNKLRRISEGKPPCKEESMQECCKSNMRSREVRDFKFLSSLSAVSGSIKTFTRQSIDGGGRLH
jgi:hypothetical protein